MLAATACRALREGKCLLVRYGGHRRIVEVHAVGRSGAGRALMLVWQVRGGSASGAAVGWKMLRLDAVQSSGFTNEAAQAPRPGYRRDDVAMAGGVACRL